MVEARQVASGSDLIPGRYYRITEIDPHDPDPTLKVGDVVLCKELAAGCIDPKNHEDDGMGTEWFADYSASYDVDGAYRTLVNSVEEVAGAVVSDSLCSVCSGPRFLCGGCPLGVPRGLTAPECPPCGCDDSKALAIELAKVTRERDYLLQFADPKEVRAMQVELAAEAE